MSSKKNRTGWWKNYHPPEEPKAHEEIPDGLGIGVLEERDHDGQLWIFFEGSRLTSKHTYVVLGRYAMPQTNGALYYVRIVDRHAGTAPTEASVRKFETILEALGFIHTLKEKFDEDLQTRTTR